MTSPHVEATGTEGGRPSTNVANHSSYIQDIIAGKKLQKEFSIVDNTGEAVESTTDDIVHINNFPGKQSKLLTPKIGDDDFHKVLCIKICSNIDEWILSGSDSAELIVQDFQNNMDTKVQVLRDKSADENKVKPLRINIDGTLQVLRLNDNEEEVLIADYLW